MTGRVALPYLDIPPDLVQGTDWALEDDAGTWWTIDEGLPGWDYRQDPVLIRTVRLPVEDCLEACGLTDVSGARLRLSVECETGPSGHRWLAYMSDALQSGTHEKTVRLALQGAELAGAIQLSTAIHLDRECSPTPRMAPRRAGTRLWRQTRVVRLEGSMGRFPMEAVDFDAAFCHLDLGRARWYLDWEPRRWDWAFLGNVQLFLNAADSDLMAELRSDRGVILAAITSDVVRQMISTLVSNEEYRQGMEDLPRWTVGGVVRDWLALAFPEEPASVVAGRLAHNPGRFDARVQAVFGGVSR